MNWYWFTSVYHLQEPRLEFFFFLQFPEMFVVKYWKIIKLFLYISILFHAQGVNSLNQLCLVWNTIQKVWLFCLKQICIQNKWTKIGTWNSKQNTIRVSYIFYEHNIEIMPVTEEDTTELAYRENWKGSGYNTVNNKRKFNWLNLIL